MRLLLYPLYATVIVAIFSVIVVGFALAYVLDLIHHT